MSIRIAAAQAYADPAWWDACLDAALWDHAPVKRAYARLHVDVDLDRIPEET